MSIQSTTHAATGPGAIGLVGLLSAAFIVLRLTGHIDWSWWWVLSPVWVSVLLVLILVGSMTGFLYYVDRRGSL